MTIINLPLADPESGVVYAPPRYVWVNADQITYWEDAGSRSRIVFLNGIELLVALPSDELAEAIDPEGQCGAATASTCLYVSYLGRRRPEDHGDLTHNGWHAADYEAGRHAKACEKSACSTCAFHERQLRA